jgi:hypothetical protein
MRLLLLISVIAACTHAQISQLMYHSPTCDDSSFIAANMMYNSGECKKSPLIAGSYSKASCSGGKIKIYSGPDSSCPDSTSITFTENECMSFGSAGMKAVCNYSPPAAGLLSNFYTSTDCSGSAVVGTFLPNGCMQSSSGYMSISCPGEIRQCSDSACSKNCVTSNTTLNTCESVSGGFSVSAQCASTKGNWLIGVYIGVGVGLLALGAVVIALSVFFYRRHHNAKYQNL